MPKKSVRRKEKLDEAKLNMAVKAKLQDVFINGMMQGSKAILGVVLEELESDNPPEKKVEILKEYCKTSLAVQEKDGE